MRVILGVMAAGLVVAGCGDKDAQRAQADAGAAGFVPPSVTSRLDFGASMERRFRTLDRNADDRITKDELPSPNARIKAFDRNKDGALSRAELLTIRTTAADANGPVPDPAARGPRKERRDRR